MLGRAAVFTVISGGATAAGAAGAPAAAVPPAGAVVVGTAGAAGGALPPAQATRSRASPTSPPGGPSRASIAVSLSLRGTAGATREQDASPGRGQPQTSLACLAWAECTTALREGQ